MVDTKIRAVTRRAKDLAGDSDAKTEYIENWKNCIYIKGIIKNSLEFPVYVYLLKPKVIIHGVAGPSFESARIVCQPPDDKANFSA